MDDEYGQQSIDPSYLYGPEAPSSSPGPSGVEFCERPADIPGLKQLGISHWWLRTPNAEAGMGPYHGGVPGEATSIDYPGIPTTMNDHTGRGDQEGSTCIPVEEHAHHPVDPECVDRELALGQETGRWFPPFNDCHDTITEILEKCRLYGEDVDWATDPGSIDKYGGKNGEGGASGY